LKKILKHTEEVDKIFEKLVEQLRELIVWLRQALGRRQQSHTLFCQAEEKCIYFIFLCEALRDFNLFSTLIFKVL